MVPDVVAHTYKPSTWEAGAGRSPMQGQPGIMSCRRA